MDTISKLGKLQRTIRGKTLSYLIQLKLTMKIWKAGGSWTLNNKVLYITHFLAVLFGSSENILTSVRGSRT